MSRLMRKPTMWFFEQVRHKPSCASTEDGYKLEMLDLGMFKKNEAFYYFESYDHILHVINDLTYLKDVF